MKINQLFQYISNDTKIRILIRIKLNLNSNILQQYIRMISQAMINKERQTFPPLRLKIKIVDMYMVEFKLLSLIVQALVHYKFYRKIG